MSSCVISIELYYLIDGAIGLTHVFDITSVDSAISSIGHTEIKELKAGLNFAVADRGLAKINF